MQPETLTLLIDTMTLTPFEVGGHRFNRLPFSKELLVEKFFIGLTHQDPVDSITDKFSKAMKDILSSMTEAKVHLLNRVWAMIAQHSIPDSGKDMLIEKIVGLLLWRSKNNELLHHHDFKHLFPKSLLKEPETPLSQLNLWWIHYLALKNLGEKVIHTYPMSYIILLLRFHKIENAQDLLRQVHLNSLWYASCKGIDIQRQLKTYEALARGDFLKVYGEPMSTETQDEMDQKIADSLNHYAEEIKDMTPIQRMAFIQGKMFKSH